MKPMLTSAALLLSLTGACGSEKTTAGSGSAAGESYSEYQVSEGGHCVVTTFPAAINDDGDDSTVPGKKCPSTISVDGKSAKLLKTCDSFKDGDNTYQVFIYDRELGEDGKGVAVKSADAAARCAEMKDSLENPVTVPTSGEEG